MRVTSILLLGALLAGCAGQRLAKADRAHDRMAYARAADLYGRIPTDRMHHAAAIRAADSYRLTGNAARAAHWYRFADSLAPLGVQARFDRATVLMTLGLHGEAAPLLMSVIEERPEHGIAEDLLAACIDHDAFYRDSARYSVALLPIPGIRGAFGPVIHGHGLLVAVEREPGMDRTNPWNGGSYLDLCRTQRRTLADWSEPVPLPGDVNGIYHEGPAALSPDGRTLYFTRSNYQRVKLRKDANDISHLKLFSAELLADGSWGDIRSFAYNSEEHSTGHPALSTDGLTLYFASDMPGGLGGSDIWRSRHDGNGWGPPENLGPGVNTPGQELFPTVNDGALYFSSSAHHNMGGLDIFICRPEGDGWSAPRNLGHPLNSVHDDMSFVLDSTGSSGYLASDRSGTDRIHHFVACSPLLQVEGMITELGTDAILPYAEITLTDLATLKDTTLFAGVDGRYHIALEAGKDYRIRAAYTGMVTQSRTISTKGLVESTMLLESFALQRVQVGRSFTIANLYYDLDKWDLRPEALRELDKLAEMFMENPRITFELGAHTDCRGSDLYNLVLSDARANSAVNYLIKQGVEPARIVAKGHGEQRPVNGCRDGVRCTEEEHQANRRTEITVLDVATTAGR